MNKIVHYIGLDVHKETIAASLAPHLEIGAGPSWSRETFINSPNAPFGFRSPARDDRT